MACEAPPPRQPVTRVCAVPPWTPPCGCGFRTGTETRTAEQSRAPTSRSDAPRQPQSTESVTFTQRSTRGRAAAGSSLYTYYYPLPRYRRRRTPRESPTPHQHPQPHIRVAGISPTFFGNVFPPGRGYPRVVRGGVARELAALKRGFAGRAAFFVRKEEVWCILTRGTYGVDQRARTDGAMDSRSLSGLAPPRQARPHQQRRRCSRPSRRRRGRRRWRAASPPRGRARCPRAASRCPSARGGATTGTA